MDVATAEVTGGVEAPSGQEPGAVARPQPLRVAVHTARVAADEPERNEDELEPPTRRQAARGRQPAGTDRTRRYVRETWAKARTDQARAKAIAAALRAGMLTELPLAALQWGQSAGVLTERQYGQAVGAAQSTPRIAEPPSEAPSAAPAPQQPVQAAQPASTPASSVATASPPAAPAQQPASPPATSTPPAGPLFMGQPAEHVAMYAGVALPVLHALASKFRSESFDPTTQRKGILFRGTPLQREVDCIPVERMADLVGVMAAKRWPPGGSGDEASQAKTELLVLGLAAFGPALATAGKRAAGALWSIGRGIGSKLRNRRAGREEAEG